MPSFCVIRRFSFCWLVIDILGWRYPTEMFHKITWLFYICWTGLEASWTTRIVPRYWTCIWKMIFWLHVDHVVYMWERVLWLWQEDLEWSKALMVDPCQRNCFGLMLGRNCLCLEGRMVNYGDNAVENVKTLVTCSEVQRAEQVCISSPACTSSEDVQAGDIKCNTFQDRAKLILLKQMFRWTVQCHFIGHESMCVRRSCYSCFVDFTHVLHRSVFCLPCFDDNRNIDS